MVQGRIRPQRRPPQGGGGRCLSDDLVGVALLGEVVVSTTLVAQGRNGAERTVATLADGRTVSVKRAMDEAAREANLLEAEVLLRLNGLHAPELLDVLDDGWTLVIAHLDTARWAPPLPKPGLVWAAIDSIGTTTPPHRVRRMQRRFDPWDDAPAAWWVGPSSWWRHAMPVLRDASANAWWHGRSLLHGDISAGNVCTSGAGVVLVDWADAAVGSLDWARVQAGLMYRLHGIEADVPIADLGPAVATIAGFVAREYDTTDDSATGAAYVVALTWACQALGLDAPPFGVLPTT